MLKSCSLALLAMSVCVLSIGCSQQRTGPDIDNTAAWTLDDLTAPIERPEKQKTWEDALPWNWETAEEKRTKTDEVLFAEDDVQEEPFLSKLAFWKSDSKKDDFKSESEYLNDMSPELSTLSERPLEVKGRVNRSIDTNTRAIWDDLLSVLMLDAPSRSNRTPVP